MNDEQKTLICPDCGSSEVTVTAEKMFMVMVNTSEHCCPSVKALESDAQSSCLECGWRGERGNLKELP